VGGGQLEGDGRLREAGVRETRQVAANLYVGGLAAALQQSGWAAWQHRMVGGLLEHTALKTGMSGAPYQDHAL
jgi:hypothetical protein